MTTRAIHQGDHDYPPGLERLKTPPPVLYVRGKTDAFCGHAVAIVGTREASSAGKAAAWNAAEACARAGYTVWSGLAKGIDGEAHRGCLAAGGLTGAVLAHGLHMVYPPEHHMLAGEVLGGGGCLVSEHPGGVAPARAQFVQRNRIVAALSDALVIAECGRESGTMHAARFARELGVPIFAIASNHPAFDRSGADHAVKALGASTVTSVGELLRRLQRLPTNRER